MYYNNEDKQRALLTEATSWLKTPFHKRSRAKGKGGGVDCVNLAQSIYFNTGAIDELKEMPRYCIDWHSHQNESILERIFKEMYPNDFVLVDNMETMKIGDLLLFNPMGKCIHHCAIYHRENWFIHAFVGKGVIETHVSTREETFTLEKIYRPIS